MAWHDNQEGSENRPNIEKVSLLTFSFKEDNVHIIYNPQLEISGYGYTEDEAKKSFEVSLSEFIRYTQDI